MLVVLPERNSVVLHDELVVFGLLGDDGWEADVANGFSFDFICERYCSLVMLILKMVVRSGRVVEMVARLEAIQLVALWSGLWVDLFLGCDKMTTVIDLELKVELVTSTRFSL